MSAWSVLGVVGLLESSKVEAIDLLLEHPRSDSKAVTIEVGTHYLTASSTLKVKWSFIAVIISIARIKAAVDVAIAIVQVACLALI